MAEYPDNIAFGIWQDELLKEAGFLLDTNIEFFILGDDVRDARDLFDGGENASDVARLFVDEGRF